MAAQTTLAREITLEGTGLHSGRRVACRLLPAGANQGIRFRLPGPAGPVEMAARVEAVCSTNRCTALEAGGARVLTVEHLLAALSGLGIDDVLVETAGGELPALDGAAEAWARAIKQAGRVRLESPRRGLRIREPIWVSEGPGALFALPGNSLRITCGVDFGFAGRRYPVAGRQLVSVAVTAASFLEELAPARTFAFAHELDELRRQGLGQGGAKDNVVLVSESGCSSPLRFSDELARHKALDLLGDLALAGAPVIGHVVAVRPSHRLNVELAGRLAKLEVEEQ